LGAAVFATSINTDAGAGRDAILDQDFLPKKTARAAIGD